MAKSLVWCAWCNARIWKPNSEINRARKAGMYLYCGRACSGLGRRIERTDSERRARKAEYDRQRRHDLRDRLKAEKAAYHKRTYDPVRAAAERRLKMPYHVEYCRRPEYRAWKREYDRSRLARKQFGEFAEAALLIRDIDFEIAKHADRYEIYRQNGTLNKAQQRKRAL